MSFFSVNNAESLLCPGAILGDSHHGLVERACIQVNKVYDSCLQQEQLDDVLVGLTKIVPRFDFQEPLQFISCKSLDTRGIIRDLSIERLVDRPQFARVRCCVDIPIEILFEDANGVAGKGFTCITVKKDVILFVPCESIIPFTANSIVSAICIEGEHRGGCSFLISICVTVILKIVAEVELLVPTYGFCAIPPCETFAQNVCDEFFGLPIFPQTDC